MIDNKNTVRELIDTINKISDQSKNTNTLYDSIKNDLPSEKGIIPRKIGDYSDISKTKNVNKQDIFEDLIKTFEGFVGVNDNNITERPIVKNKIRRYTEESAKTALRSSKQMFIDEIKNNFFIGDGVCGSNIIITGDTITLAPKEFDLTNMLKIDPESTSGTILYESTEDTGEIKMNRELYNLFDSSGNTFNFDNNTGGTLFNMSWNDINQEYNISGLTSVNKVIEFVNDYYSLIDFPNINDVIKQAMLMTIQGDGTESKTFSIGTDMLERLLNKMFSACGQQTTKLPLNQTAVEEEDQESYFDFDDVEGINIDDEDARSRRVLKFVDCNNFEIPINTNHIEDFAYFSSKKNINENVTNTLNKVAIEAYEESEKSITLQNLEISLTGLYILKVPRAIISTVLSPKMIYPIVTLYKVLNNSTIVIDVKDIMKRLSKLFFSIIKKIFWKFIKEFWGYMKKEMLIFVTKIALKIIKNKLKRWKTIIIALISLLIKLLTTTIDSCGSIYKAILDTIESALNVNVNIPIPGILLLFADSLPGYSSEKAYMNVVNNLTASGIEMGTLYGRDNKLNDMIKGILEGHTQEMDTNSYVKITLKEAVLPSSLVSTFITPGTVMGVGKVV
jgi:hypothetical protein